MSRARKSICLFAAILALCSAATAAEGELTGSYSLGSATVVDPPPGETRGTHFRLFLTGESAKSLYDAMRAEPAEDECLADGSLTKFIGGTACTKHAGGTEFTCSLAIAIETQRVETAYTC